MHVCSSSSFPFLSLRLIDYAIIEKILKSNEDEGKLQLFDIYVSLLQLLSCLFFPLPFVVLVPKQGRILGLKPSGVSQHCCLIFCVLINMLLFGFFFLSSPFVVKEGSFF